MNMYPGNLTKDLALLKELSDIADLGRRTEAFIMVSDYDKELNVWHEAEYCTYLINQYNEDNNE